jgi:hypothetical protein
LYKCYACGKQFRGGNRLIPEEIWLLYTLGKQTYSQLATRYQCSTKTIQRKIDTIKIELKQVYVRVANVIMDTTYFGKQWGVMVFKDSLSGQYLHKQYVKYETNQLYSQGIEQIIKRGISIQAIICDGRKGLFNLFSDIPIQMCQFHQSQIITRYLTRNPKTPAAIELRELTMQLTKIKKVDFEKAIIQWHNNWESFLKERTVSEITGKSHYTHKRLRSAWLSLKRNLPWLFTFETYPELLIPNTTNGLDGSFADLKNKLRNHNGLNTQRKRKIIDGFFKA